MGMLSQKIRCPLPATLSGRPYGAACVIASPLDAAKTGQFSELSELTGLKTFVTNLPGHVAVEVAR